MRKRKHFGKARPLVNSDIYHYFTALTTVQGLNPRFVLNYLMAIYIKETERSVEFADLRAAIYEEAAGYEMFIENTAETRAQGEAIRQRIAPVIERAADPWKEGL